MQREPETLAESTSPARVELDSFQVRAGTSPLTPALDWRLKAGEFGLLLGGLGSGKSLIMETLAGVVRPDLTVSGRAHLEPRTAASGRRAASVRVSLVPQDSRLAAFGTDQVDSLLGAGWHRSGLRRWIQRLDRRSDAAREETERLLEALALSPRRVLTLEFRELSGGERHRVLLAMALLEKNPLLIYDGLGEGLDPGDRRRVERLLRDHLTKGGLLLAAARRAPSLDLPEPRCVTLGAGRRQTSTRPPSSSPTSVVPPPPGTEPPQGPAASEALLRVEDLRVGRGRRRIGGGGRAAYPIDGASLEVATGEAVAVLGASGSGKTTLLEALGGLLVPTSGKIRWRGGVMLDPRRLLRRRYASIQLVFQDAAQALGDERTVRQHLRGAARLARQLEGKAGAETLEPEAWLSRVGLPARLLDLSTDHLSAGEAQRIDLVRSLVLDPELILLDAPRVGGVDSDDGQLLALAAARKARGKAFLVATSDPGIAAALADRIAVLVAGRIVEIGAAREVLASPLHPATAAQLEGRELPPPEPQRPPRGCPFVGSCPRRMLPLCDEEMPRLVQLAPPPTGLAAAASSTASASHRVACHNPLPSPPPEDSAS
ncbi:MAG TPA: ATP-binding cassette domain-containing protein [Polyangiaceae bacterium]|nr:ATP-binding cassette domain-containing protein [Polyangiaceae bacterium]